MSNWIKYGYPFYDSVDKSLFKDGLHQPGTLIKTKEGIFLIGDINMDGGTCNCCHAVHGTDIVDEYKVVWTPLHIFKSISSFVVSGHKCFTVKNPIVCDNFSHIIGHEVYIDRLIYTVIAVERLLHMPPWHKDETISLMTKEKADATTSGN